MTATFESSIAEKMCRATRLAVYGEAQTKDLALRVAFVHIIAQR